MPDHLHGPIVWKSWNLNLLEPTGAVQACTGICFNLIVAKLIKKVHALYGNKKLVLIFRRSRQ